MTQTSGPGDLITSGAGTQVTDDRHQANKQSQRCRLCPREFVSNVCDGAWFVNMFLCRSHIELKNSQPQHSTT